MVEPQRLRLCARVNAAVALAAAALALAPEAQAETAQAGRSASVRAAIANAGFEEGRVGEAPPGWHGSIAPAGAQAPSAPRFVARIDPESPREGRASVRLEHVAETADPAQFGTVTSSIPAAAYRGRRVRLTGSVRAEVPAETHVGLWLRVDRQDRLPGAFDNMADRPIRSASWADYTIEADVAPDAEHIVFGLLLAGPGRAWMDNVRLEMIGSARTAGEGRPGPVQRPRAAAGPGDEPARALSPQGLRNLSAFAELYGIVRYFHPSDEGADADWGAFAMLGVEQVEGARTPAELAVRLRSLFAPLGGSVEIFASPAPPRRLGRPIQRPRGSGNAVRWRHVGLGEYGGGGSYSSTRIDAEAVLEDDIVEVALDGGVSARVPLALWRDSEGRTIPRGRGALPPSRKPAGFVPAGFDRTTRLAAVVEAWTVLQHGYPYFDVVEVDWERQLGTALAAAALDPDDQAFHRTLRRMVSTLQDGHGNVAYASANTGILPLAWDEVEGSLLVTAVGQGVSRIAPGDVVTHIGGRPVEEVMSELGAMISGSRQWTRHRARAEALAGMTGQTVELRVVGPHGAARSVPLAYRAVQAGGAVSAPQPEPIAELAPGILYVDLDRVTDEMMRARDADLAAARGLVFDLRGYPRTSPGFLTRIARRPVQSAHFEAPVFLRPNREGVTFGDGAWNLEPMAPSWTRNVAFITNGSAISYAESVLGVVAGNELGDIVGEATAGANGNVAFQVLPGAYRVTWTGMRVRNRDGTRHHLRGVQPTVPVSRTIAGARAGRDEMLERALALVRSRIPDGPAAGR